MKFPTKDFFSKSLNPQKTAKLATFTEEIIEEKLHFLYSVTDTNDTNHNILTELLVVFIQTLDTAISADTAPASLTK